MNLKPQAEELIRQASSKYVSADLLEDIIIPTLISYAKRIKRSHLYLWNNWLENEWVVNTLVLRNKSTIKKNIVYAFVSHQQAKQHPDFEPETMDIEEVPILFLLFKLVPLKQVDSLVIFPHKNSYQRSVELNRELMLTILRDKIEEDPRHKKFSLYLA